VTMIPRCLGLKGAVSAVDYTPVSVHGLILPCMQFYSSDKGPSLETSPSSPYR
jgi:hypothetical protein